VDADMTEEHPKVYSKIHLIYEFTGKDLQASIKQIEKAVHLSQNRYCGVADMLGKAAELTNEIRLIEG
jgi:putative redox protein